MKIKHWYWKFEEDLIKWCRTRFQLPHRKSDLKRPLPKGWEICPDKYNVIQRKTWRDKFKCFLEKIFEPSGRRWCRRLDLPYSSLPTKEEWNNYEIRYKEWQGVVRGSV